MFLPYMPVAWLPWSGNTSNLILQRLRLLEYARPGNPAAERLLQQMGLLEQSIRRNLGIIRQEIDLRINK
ncbi:MAG: hypothetical protein IPG32_09970 [Saprospirales bacterium]|nr:hypothetical protein [Saprospirales bacterium]